MATPTLPAASSSTNPPPPAAADNAQKRKKKSTKAANASSNLEDSKKKQVTSCDACRVRKVKCSRDDPLPDGFNPKSPGVDVPPCRPCASLGIPCVYKYEPKKRGPPNQYLKRLLQEQQTQGGDGITLAGQLKEEHEDEVLSDPSAGGSLSPPYPERSLATHDGTAPSIYPPPSLTTSYSYSSSSLQDGASFNTATLPSFEPSPPITPSPFAILSSAQPRLSTRRTSSMTVYEAEHRPSLAPLALSSGEDTALDLQPLDSGPSNEFLFSPPPSDLYSLSAMDDLGVSSPLNLALNRQLPTSDERTVSRWMQSTSLVSSTEEPAPFGRPLGGSMDAGMSDVSTPASHFSDGQVRQQRIDDVLPRSTAVYILSLFFDFVWVLTPCLHKQTFFADLEARREERDPLFFALVMSTLASTLLQVPKIQVPVAANEVRTLATKCFHASRRRLLMLLSRCSDPPQFLMVIIRYFDTIYQFVIGNRWANTTTYAEALEIAFQLNLNNESAYVGFDPIETELRRRIFFLLFVADKSMACLLGRVITLRRDDVNGVALPTEVDDACLTREGYLPQPPGRTPLIIGFNLAARTFALLGAVLEAQREVQKLPKPIEPSIIVSKLREVGSMIATASSITAEAPAAFRPAVRFDSARNSPAADWNDVAMAQIQDYFSKPTSQDGAAKDGYLVSTANLWVTWAWVRFNLIQYRDQLLEMSGPVGSPARTAAERVMSDREGTHDTREMIAVDLLNTLHNIPIQSLAVNGPSLVQKTRYVAATFLEASSATDPGEAGQARISAFLFEFLNILSEIEKHFAE